MLTTHHHKQRYKCHGTSSLLLPCVFMTWCVGRGATSLTVLYRILTIWVRYFMSVQKSGIIQIFGNDMNRSKLHSYTKYVQKKFGKFLLPFSSECLDSMKGGNLNIWVIGASQEGHCTMELIISCKTICPSPRHCYVVHCFYSEPSTGGPLLSPESWLS